MSKYHDIYNDLLEKINQGIYPAGSKLPGEFELMRIYDSSRDTIRKSLSLLAQNGCIHKAKGSGSIVIAMKRSVSPLYDLSGYGDTFNASAENLHPKVILLDKILPPVNVREILSIGKNEHVWMLKRIWFNKDKPVVLQTDYFNASYIPSLTPEVAGYSLFAYLENECGLQISYAEQEISCQTASDEEAEHLLIPQNAMIIKFETKAYLEDASIFQYSLAGCITEQFRYRHFERRIRKA